MEQFLSSDICRIIKNISLSLEMFHSKNKHFKNYYYSLFTLEISWYNFVCGIFYLNQLQQFIGYFLVISHNSREISSNIVLKLCQKKYSSISSKLYFYLHVIDHTVKYMKNVLQRKGRWSTKFLHCVILQPTRHPDHIYMNFGKSD